MSLLETVSQGHVLFEEGFSYIPSSKDIIKKIKTKLLPHQASFCDDISHRKLALVCGFGAGKTYALVSKRLMRPSVQV